MGKRDIRSHVAVEPSLHPAARTANASGTAVDTRGYGSAAFILQTGALTDGAFTFVLQESDTTTDGDFTAVASDDLDGSIPTVSGNTSPETGEDAVTVIGYKGGKRYLRVRVTVANLASPPVGGVVGGLIMLSHAAQQPVA